MSYYVKLSISDYKVNNYLSLIVYKSLVFNLSYSVILGFSNYKEYIYFFFYKST